MEKLKRLLTSPKLPPWATIIIVAIERAGDADFLATTVGRIGQRWPGLGPMIYQQWDTWGWFVVLVIGFVWLWWTGRYEIRTEGAPRPPKEARRQPPSIARQAALVRVAEALPKIDAAVTALTSVWYKLADQDTARKRNAAAKWLGGLLEKQEIKPTKEALRRLTEAVAEGDHAQPEEPLLVVWEKYRRLCNVIRDFAQAIEADLTLLEEYKLWWGRNETFVESMSQLRQQPALDVLESRFNALPSDRQHLPQMPPLRQPPSHRRLTAFYDEGRALAEAAGNSAGDGTFDVQERVSAWIDQVVAFLRAESGEADVIAFGGPFEPHQFMSLTPPGLRGRVEARLRGLDQLIAKYGPGLMPSDVGTAAPRPPSVG